MNISKSALVSILFAAVVLLVGWLFWPFILNEIISPIARVIWLLLRIFILSIDQIYFWMAVIFIAFIIIYRLLPQDSKATPPEASLDTNETLLNIEFWRNIFFMTDFNAYDESRLKRELIQLVAALYASKQRTPASFLFSEALERGEIYLPPAIHAFLFPQKPVKTGFPLIRLVETWLEAPRQWMRRRNGQEKAEYYRMIDEIFNFIETSLEMENDTAKLSPYEH